MHLTFDPSSSSSYRKFLQVKRLPIYRFIGHSAWFPDEYASRIGIDAGESLSVTYDPIGGLFDYQEAIVRMAISKRKYAVFADCGLGKTMILLEFARIAKQAIGRKSVLILSPLMVIKQTMSECDKWYGGSVQLEQIRAKDLGAWMQKGRGIGITNYDAITEDLEIGRVGAIILDESSMLKSHYGRWATKILDLGRGLEWKLCCTGTPAPNDRIEYANHAVFLDAFPTVNAFLARFFINRGQTSERWEMKHHAIGPFYRALSHWSIFLTNPSTYGWKDNVTDSVPPINVIVHEVELTQSQKTAAANLTGTLFTVAPGGIGSRAKLARISKSGDSLKPEFIRSLCDSWNGESTIVWCRFNDEQEAVHAAIPGSESISGNTPHDERMDIIDRFKAGITKVIVTKPKILGFGLNLQIATRQIFSSLHDSYEEYYQAVKRSNRIGSTRPLNVHIPVTDAERPMVENVLRKAALVHQDTIEQERIFRDARIS